ncbi:MAG: isoprenylcysteine carboxylmethyltransferase family protein [Ferruginibacter sp.]
MLKSHFILGACWVLYGFLHSMLANETVKSGITSSLGIKPASYRIGYNVFAAVTLVIILYFLVKIQSRYLFTSLIVQFIIAPIFIVAGISIMIYCIIKYFRQLSGLNGNSDKLIISGLHSFVRHPLYSGTFLFLAGLFLLMPSLANLISVIIIISYTVLAIPLEEKKLVKQFGDQYISYIKNVPTFFPKWLK